MQKGGDISHVGSKRTASTGAQIYAGISLVFNRKTDVAERRAGTKITKKRVFLSARSVDDKSAAQGQIKQNDNENWRETHTHELFCGNRAGNIALGLGRLSGTHTRTRLSDE